MSPESRLVLYEPNSNAVLAATGIRHRAQFLADALVDAGRILPETCERYKKSGTDEPKQHGVLNCRGTTFVGERLT